MGQQKEMRRVDQALRWIGWILEEGVMGMHP
jgi:hypothetical protein